MKIDRLVDAIGAIAPEYIEEAELWDGAAAQHKGKIPGYARWRKILLPVAACLALAVVGGTAGIWYMGNAGAGRPDRSAADSGASADMAAGAADAGDASDSGGMAGGINDSAADVVAEELEEGKNVAQEAVPDEGAAQAGGNAKGELIVNEVDAFYVAIADHAAPAFERYYTVEELENYYGIRLLPEEIPQGFTLVGEETPYVIGYDENDEVMDDNCTLLFSTDRAGCRLEISARTVDVGEMRGFEGQDLVPSYFYGQEVTVAHLGEEYLAVYERNGVTVTVWVLGLDEEELYIVLEGLLRNP